MVLVVRSIRTMIDRPPCKTRGDWGGLDARHLSNMSIDHALIAFAGGTTSVPGGFAGFNAIEFHQAKGRVANSVIENNASGVGGNLAAGRGGRGFECLGSHLCRRQSARDHQQHHSQQPGHIHQR